MRRNINTLSIALMHICIKVVICAKATRKARDKTHAIGV